LGNAKGFLPGTRRVRKTFPAWGREKKQQQGHHAATFIMQQRQQQKSHLRNTSKCMGASKSMSKDKSMDASNIRADNRRNTFNGMDASNIMD
jgi:hypothetical protein